MPASGTFGSGQEYSGVVDLNAKRVFFTGTYPAYGYRRDPLDKHHLVIDEETAPVVRRIFEMRASNASFWKMGGGRNGARGNA